MHDHRRFPPATPGYYSPAPFTLDEQPVAVPHRQHEAAPPPPALPDQPLFLDEPDLPVDARPARGPAVSDLFLDEDSPMTWVRSQPAGPAIWDNAEPALSPTTDAQGETRFAVSPRTRVGAAMSGFARPSLLKAVIVVGVALALAAISLLQAQSASPLSLWRGLGF